jgi:hypothetical protein
MKIRCKQSNCEVCGKVSTIQLFYNKSGEIKYGRAMHYKGRVDGKPQFEYHQQTLQYIIGHIGHSLDVDLEKAENSSKSNCMAGGKGFEPLTLSLEG